MEKQNRINFLEQKINLHEINKYIIEGYREELKELKELENKKKTEESDSYIYSLQFTDTKNKIVTFGSWSTEEKASKFLPKSNIYFHMFYFHGIYDENNNYPRRKQIFEINEVYKCKVVQLLKVNCDKLTLSYINLFWEIHLRGDFNTHLIQDIAETYILGPRISTLNYSIQNRDYYDKTGYYLSN